MTFSFFVPGDPAAQGRPRARVMRFGKRAVPQIYNPHNADDWKARVAIFARPLVPKAPMLGPIRVTMTFMLDRPNSHYKGKARVLRPDAPLWHITKPDKDNFEKAVLDALTGIRMWGDDCQVCDGRVQKIYISDGKPGCLITIQQVDTEPYHELCLSESVCPTQDYLDRSESISISQALKAPATTD